MPIFALADCNNFYVSCERVFAPELKDKPIAVLSNNDGCIISRSNEVKALKIPMGAPYFQYKKICEENKVQVLSSNYQLYGDISNRVMNIFHELIPEVEVYSIDEAFFKLDKLEGMELSNYCEIVKSKIMQYTGIPVSIGIGSTKVLAKIANRLAKKSENGVIDIRDSTVQDIILKNFDVEDIWGIGRKLAYRLKKSGILKAYQLKNADNKHMRKIFGLVVERIVLELRGVACFDLENNPQPKKNICISRSFGRPVTMISELEEAIADYAARACEKMRKQGSKAQGINVFVQTNYHDSTSEYYSSASSYWFEQPAEDTSLVIKRAKMLLRELFKPGLKYKKAGINLLGLCDRGCFQGNLLSPNDNIKEGRVTKLLDHINSKMGKRTVFFAAQGIHRSWQMRCSNRSLCYTSKWEQLPVAY